MPWLGAGTGATARGVAAGVGGILGEGDSGCSSTDDPGAGTSGACEGEPGGSRCRLPQKGKLSRELPRQ
jgi:hypothetical protein